jgi:hypothetical protein
MAEIRRVGGNSKVDEKSPGKPVIEIYFDIQDPDDPKPTDATLVHLEGFRNCGCSGYNTPRSVTLGWFTLKG